MIPMFHRVHRRFRDGSFQILQPCGREPEITDQLGHPVHDGDVVAVEGSMGVKRFGFDGTDAFDLGDFVAQAVRITAHA